MEVEENLTLDLLFSMVNSELEQLLTRCCIVTTEGKKLLGALDLLTTYYGKCREGQSVQGRAGQGRGAVAGEGSGRGGGQWQGKAVAGEGGSGKGRQGRGGQR